DFVDLASRGSHSNRQRYFPAAAAIRDALARVVPHDPRADRRRRSHPRSACSGRGDRSVTDSSPPGVTAQHLSKGDGQGTGLNGVPLVGPPGIPGLLGPKGAGKSTFMKLITGQLEPSQGTISVLGEPIWGNPALYFRIGFCPEQDAFY